MLTSSRILDFLGLHFNPEKAIISPPNSFLDSLTSVLSRLATSMVMPARKISSITNRISHFVPFIHHGRLQLRFLRFRIKRHWAQHRQSWDTPLQLDAEFLSHLRWLPDVLQGVPLHLPEPNLFFFTDASLTGWGARWQARHLSGQWSPKDSSQHINWLELEAIRLALLQWGPQWHNQTVCVYCDKSTVVAYIRKQGGTHSISLFNKTLENFRLLDQFGILLIPTHLPGAKNTTADALSRRNSPSQTEWRLPQETLLNLFSVCGNPLMDMFATAENRVTPIYISPYPDDRAWAVDALSISWDGLGLVYVFPPAPIVPKTLQKIKDSQGTTVMLIASQHSSRPTTAQPTSSHSVDQYVPNIRQPQFHSEPRLLDLAAWILSGISWNSTTSLMLLWIWQLILYVILPVTSIILNGRPLPSGPMTKTSSPKTSLMSRWRSTLFIFTLKTSKWIPSKYTGLPLPVSLRCSIHQPLFRRT